MEWTDKQEEPAPTDARRSTAQTASNACVCVLFLDNMFRAYLWEVVYHAARVCDLFVATHQKKRADQRETQTANKERASECVCLSVCARNVILFCGVVINYDAPLSDKNSQASLTPG